MSWSSRFGSRLGTWSPFGRPGQPAEVTDEGFSYITAADLDNNNILPLPSTPHSQRTRDTDVLVLKHQKVSYPVHFPAYSIEDGELTIGELRAQAAKKMGVKDPARIKMFYRGKSLKDDARTAREEGLRNNAELMCVVGDAPLAPPPKSEDEESEDTGLEDGDAEAKPKRKRNRGKKGKKLASKKTTPTASDSGYNTDAPRPAQQPPPPPQPQTPVQKLEAIASEFHRTLVPQCIQFTASPPSDPAKRGFEHKRLTETILAQVLLKLDAVETEGDADARAKRKELVREVQGMLSRLDEVVRMR